MALNVTLLVYAVLQFIAFFFVLVATPIDMFRGFLQPPFLDACVTLWGSKMDCQNAHHTSAIDTLWAACPARRRRFHAAQAFAIISILVYGAAFVLGVIMLLYSTYLRFVSLTLNIVGAVTVWVVWAAMVVTYYKDEGMTCRDLKTSAFFGAGFALFVIAWVLDILNIFVLVLSMCTTNATEKGQVEQKE